MGTRTRVWVVVALVLVAGLASEAVAAPAPGWSTEIVDASDSSGLFSSLAFNPVTGFPAIAYSATPGRQGQLRLAEWNGAAWTVQVAAAGRNIGQSGVSLAFDAAGNPGISYCDSGLCRCPAVRRYLD